MFQKSKNFLNRSSKSEYLLSLKTAFFAPLGCADHGPRKRFTLKLCEFCSSEQNAGEEKQIERQKMNIEQKARKFLAGKEFYQFGTVNEWTTKNNSGITWIHEGSPFAKMNLQGTVKFYVGPYGTPPINKRIKEIKRQMKKVKND